MELPPFGYKPHPPATVDCLAQFCFLREGANFFLTFKKDDLYE
jgi:hypothetical protein